MSLAPGVLKGWDFYGAGTSGPRLIGCEVKHGGLQRRVYTSLIENLLSTVVTWRVYVLLQTRIPLSRFRQYKGKVDYSSDTSTNIEKPGLVSSSHEC